jgi:hypothetical protein
MLIIREGMAAHDIVFVRAASAGPGGRSKIIPIHLCSVSMAPAGVTVPRDPIRATLREMTTTPAISCAEKSNH